MVSAVHDPNMDANREIFFIPKVSGMRETEVGYGILLAAMVGFFPMLIVMAVLILLVVC